MLLSVLAVLMFVVATVFSMLGLGGGVLYTPIQVWAGINFHAAATTSLFLILLTSLSASIVFRKANMIDWPLGLARVAGVGRGGVCWWPDWQPYFHPSEQKEIKKELRMVPVCHCRHDVASSLNDTLS